MVIKKEVKRKTKASYKFIVALALVSIIGFLAIVSSTLFSFDFSIYQEALLMIIIGIGLMLEGQVKSLDKIKTQGLTPKNFTHLITVIIGAIAIIAGIFSLPQIRIEAQGFIAVKGIVALIAIIIIVIQTWILE